MTIYWKTVIFLEWFFSNCRSKSSIIDHITLSRMILLKYQLSELGHVGCVDIVAIHNSTVHEADFEVFIHLTFIKHQTTKPCYFIFHSMVCHDMMVWKRGKLQSHKIEGLCLLLNCTSPCTNPLTLFQLHWIFSSWLHVPSLLDVHLIIRKYNELNHHDRAQININSDNNTTQCLQLGFQTIISWETMFTLLTIFQFSNYKINKFDMHLVNVH